MISVIDDQGSLNTWGHIAYDELIWSQLVNNLDNKDFENDFTQKKKLNNTDPNTNTSNTKFNSSNDSHTPLHSKSPKQSHTSFSNLFEILQIYPTNISRDIKIAYRKLARLFHPDKWTDDKSFSKNEAEENFKELSNTYEDIIQFVCLN